ncbi:MAG TPA: hypothetical protein DCS93_07065 [Microscillaceae bacterium]|nr:hypothetical protein [Microscillaceae bacterium]
MKPTIYILKSVFGLLALFIIISESSLAQCNSPGIGATINGNSAACEKILFSFKITGYTGNQAITEYEIDFGDGSPSQILKHSDLNPSGKHFVTHEYTENSCVSSYAEDFDNNVKGYKFTVVARIPGCSGVNGSKTATVGPVVVAVGPKAQFSAPLGCVNESVTFTNNSSSGQDETCADEATHSWDFGDPTSANNQISTNGKQNVTHTYAKAGTYEVRLIVKNITCDADTTYRDITICTPPTSLFDINGINSQACNTTLPTITQCAPFTLNLNNQTIDTCNVNHRWSVNAADGFIFSNNQLISTSRNKSITFDSVGTYIITHRAQNHCGFSETCFRVVVQDAPTVPTIVGLQSWYCSPGTVDVSTTTSGIVNNAAITGYLWEFKGINGTVIPPSPANANTADPGPLTNLPAGDYEVTLTVTSSCGNNSQTQTFQVLDPPPANAGFDQIVCPGEAVTIGGGAVDNVITYSWQRISASGNNVANANQLYTTVTNTQPGIYEYELTASRGNGCQTTDIVRVEVKAIPTIGLTSTQTIICVGQSVTLNASGASNFQWSANNANGGLSNTVGPSVVATPTQTTIYTVQGTVTGHCQNTATITVVVNPLPTITTNAPSGICRGQSVQITALGAQTYTWKPNNGLSASSGNSVTFSPTTTTTYTVIGTNANGCIDSTQFILEVYTPPTVTATADLDICRGESASLTASGANSYTWSASMGGATQSGSNIVVTPTTTTTYTVMGTDGNGCQDAAQVTVTVKDVPTVNAGQDFAICIDAASVDLSTRTGVSPAGGNWLGAGVNATGTFDPSAAGTGTKQVIYSFQGTNGCANTDTLLITVNPLPLINLSQTPTLFCNTNTNVAVTTWTALPSGGTWTGPGISGQVFTPQSAGLGVHYLQYFYQDGNGCSALDSIRIQVDAPVNIEAGPDTNICQNAPLLLTGYAPATLSATEGRWSITGANASAASITNGNIFTATQAGTYTLVYTYGVGTCEVSDTRQILVKPLPAATITTSDPTGFCQGLAINVTLQANLGAGLSYEWFKNNVKISGETNSTLSVTAIGDYTVKVTLDGCSTTSAPLSVINHPLPQPNFDANALYCVGQSITFNNTTPALAGYNISYQWDFGDGTNSVATQGAHTYTDTALVRQVTLTATTSAGCVASVTKNVRIIAPPEINISKNVIPTNGCGPLQATFANASTGYGLTFNWGFGNGQTSTASSPTVTYQASLYQDTTYYVRLTVNNPCGTETYLDTVQLKPSPTADFIFEKEVICSNYPLRLFNKSYGLPTRYEWDFGDGSPIFSTTDTGFVSHNFIYTGATDTTYQITLTAFNDCGSDQINKTLRVTRNVVTSFFQVDKDQGCAPLTVNFVSNQQTQFNTTLIWDWGDGSASNGGLSQSHTYDSAGVYQAKLIVSIGCNVDTFARAIEVLPLPVAAFDMPSEVCLNEPLPLSNTSPNPFGSLWDFGDGTTHTGTTPPAKYFAQAGTYTVSLTVTNPANGCQQTTSKTIRINSLPQPGFNVPNLICQGDPTPFGNTSSGTTRYAWDFGDGQGSSLASPSHVYQQAGTFTVRLVAFNQTNCADTIEQKIVVNPRPTSAFGLSSQFSCEHPIVVTTSNTSQGANAYHWLLNGQKVAETPDNQFTFTKPGTYTIALVAFSPVGCTDTTRYDYKVVEQPIPDFSIESQVGCQPFAVTFTNTSQFADAWVWDFGDGTTSTLESPIHVYQQAGVFTVKLTATHQRLCQDSVTKNSYITVHPKPKAAFSCEPTVDDDGTVEFTNLSEGAVRFFWELGDGTKSTDYSLSHRYLVNGNFTVTLIVESDQGCTDTTTKEVEINTLFGLKIPNAFAPDVIIGDQNSEAKIFKPKGVGLKEFELVVFDGLGNEVWRTTELNNDGQPTGFWDGMYKNKPLPKGAYVWKVTKAVFDNGQVWNGQNIGSGGKGRLYKAGSLTILR